MKNTKHKIQYYVKWFNKNGHFESKSYLSQEKYEDLMNGKVVIENYNRPNNSWDPESDVTNITNVITLDKVTHIRKIEKIETEEVLYAKKYSEVVSEAKLSNP